MTAYQLKPKTISNQEISFSYLEAGVGEALMLLHGIGSGARSWVNQLQRLSTGLRVLAWDAPGYGSSTPLKPLEPDSSQYSGCLALFLDLLKIDKVHLVGHSLGAIMATRFAREYSDRVQTLTLANPSGGHGNFPPEKRAELREARLSNLRQLGPAEMAKQRGPRLVYKCSPDEVRQTVIETMASINPLGYTQAVHLLSASNTGDDLTNLPPHIPVQFIIGQEDEITLPQNSISLAKNRPAALIHTVADSGHAVYLEQPDSFNLLLQTFIKAHPAA